MNIPVQQRMAIGLWLLICAAVVYLMIVVGGVTRLTQSGLSMVEWQPIGGILPPLSEAAWLEEFALYRQSPEYQKVNAGMSLEAFKSIFWWEWGHRVLGRFIGLIYFVPLVIFWLKGWIPKGWRLRFAGLFVLGGLQGLMGWYMVQSGLVDEPRVSQYRLTAHLSLALVIFSSMLWFALDFLRGDQRHKLASARYLKLTVFAIGVVFLMMMSGGFVAGTKAGYIINTFPTMNGEWIPTGVWAMSPGWLNLFENAITIQFTHRMLALVVVGVLLWGFFEARTQPFKSAYAWVALALTLQVVLGISALVYNVPITLGALHQAGAVALLSSVLFAAHCARRKPHAG